MMLPVLLFAFLQSGLSFGQAPVPPVPLNTQPWTKETNEAAPASTLVNTTESAPAPKKKLLCEEYSYQDLDTELTNRLLTSASNKENLQILVYGKEILKVPAEALFAIDLSSPVAVAKRIDALKSVFMRNATPEVPDDDFLTCARKTPGMEDKINELKKNQIDVFKYRLAFLSHSQQIRTDLLETQKSGIYQREQQKQLAVEIDTAQKESQEAELSISVAEEQARLAVDQNQKELASQRAILEKTKQDIAQAQIDRSTALKNRSEFYRLYSEKLSLLAASLAGIQNGASKRSYMEANDIWRMLVDRTFSEIDTGNTLTSDLPQLPKFPDKLVNELSSQQIAKDYVKAYNTAKILRSQTILKRADRLEKFRSNHYTMLLQSSRLRSQYLQKTIAEGDTSIIKLSNDYFLDLWREIRVVPYRSLAIFYTAALDVKDRITGGVSGILSLFKDGILLFFFIAIPISVFLGLKRLTSRIDRLRDQLMRSGDVASWRSSLALWLKRINPYLPWVLMLCGLWIAEALLANSDLVNIRDIFSYVKYYIWYRIFKLFVSITLSRAAYTTNLRGLSTLKPRIEKTTNLVSIFFFAGFVLLRITEGTVGAALVYRIVSTIIIYIGWGILAYCAYTWRDQVALSIAKSFPKKLVKKTQELCTHKQYGFFVCLPVVSALTLIAIVKRIDNWISKFEFYKKISVEILKRKLDVDEEDGEVGAEETDTTKSRFRTAKQKYLEHFSLTVPEDTSVIIQPAHGIDKRIENIIRSWADGNSDEFSLAIYGEKGVGKSTALCVMKETFSELDIVEISIPPKLTVRDKVISFICSALNITEGQDLDQMEKDQSIKKKTLILIDEAHNMFLAELGGFDGYRGFLELVNAKIPNVFWCVVYNRRAWKYLDNVLGRNQFFRNIFEIKSFTDEDMQSMIMNRHRKSGFSLEFDEMILAASKSDEMGGIAHAETQFFRLLWGLAKGNPRTAIALWNQSISMINTTKVLVGIPKPLVLRELNQLNEDNYFVFGSILTHENLDAGEAIVTTNLPEGVVRNALKIGEEIEALDHSADGRYRVNPLAQSRLIDFLLDKNIVYE